MPSPLRTTLAALAAVTFSILPSYAQSSRITDQAVSSSARITLKHTLSPRIRAATDLGAAPADRTLSSVTLRFNMSDAQTSALDNLMAAQQNPQSPLYHQWLTPEQYAAQFGLSSTDVAKVTAWLQSQGLTVTGVARGRSFVTVSGTVGQLQNAFGTTIHAIQLDGEQHISPLTEPTLPAAIASVTSTVTGLSDIRLKPHVRPRFTSSLTGNHYLAPGDFFTIYDSNPLITSSINGAGITIAVAGQTDISVADVAAFRAASGLPAKAPTIKLIGNDPGIPSTEDLIEASLDTEWSGAVAPGATILYVNSTDVIGGSLTQIIDQNLAPIATVSYGDCESNFGSSNVAVYNQLFRQAAVQGQTIAGPAGDSGATDCDYQTNVATQGLAVDFPASSPYVTGVGGTMFNEGSGTYWSAANSTAYNGSSSALSYIPEAVWNESTPTGGIGAGGGGASTFFTKPAWQVGTGVPADFSRDVPDLSFTSADHDGILICHAGACVNGYRDASNNLDVVAGTSFATPAFAGVMALLEQKLQTRVGLANPTIYALANSTYYTNVFHDVTAGNNDSPCTLGTTGCTTSITTCDGYATSGQGCIGYNATVGYDQASGWGSLDIFNFVNDWTLVTALSSGTNGNTSSATTITSSAASVSSGASITLTTKVTSATSSVTATPTGTVQLLIDGRAFGSAVALSSGTATFTYSTTSLSSGNHVFTAAYSGDTNYSGSKGVVTVDVVSTSAADFTLTPSTATVTVKSGSTATGLTYTVTPVQGFTGPVTFNASSPSSTLSASYTFSVDPVTISGTTAGTTVFTLSAYASNAVGVGGLHKIGTGAAAAHLPAKPGNWAIPSAGIAFAGLVLLVLPRRRSRWTALVLAIVSVAALGLSGCSTSSGAVTSTTTTTSSGTYTVIVTASGINSAGTAISHSSTVTFVVQ